MTRERAIKILLDEGQHLGSIKLAQIILAAYRLQGGIKIEGDPEQRLCYLVHITLPKVEVQ